MLINWDSFAGMELGNTKQSLLRDYRSAVDALNTKLWDGSLRPYRTPTLVGSCSGSFVLDNDFKPVCQSSCAAYAMSPCGTNKLYSLKGGYLHRGDAAVGLARPLQKPSVTVSGKGEGDSIRLRVLCLNDDGEYSPPSEMSDMITPKYGDAVIVQWSGCSPYRVQALLTQSISGNREVGKDKTEWLTVGDFKSSVAVFNFEPEGWALTSDGFDANSFCNPPELSCFVVTEDGFFAGWNKNLLYISERHDPSKFMRVNIKNLFANILDVVTAKSVLYISTDQGIYVARLDPTKDGVQVSIAKTHENAIPIVGTLSAINSAAMYATPYGMHIIDEAGRQPQNVSSQFIAEDEFKEKWLPVTGVSQRGTYYATTKTESWHLDYPSSSGDTAQYGRLVRLDKLGSHQFAGRDGIVYYSDSGGVKAFNQGKSFLSAEWRSTDARMPSRTGLSRYKVIGENLEGVKMLIYADDKLAFTDTLTTSKICVLPRCVIGSRFSVKFIIPAKSVETVIKQLQLATSVQELARVS